jgi:hypothetical protein
MKITTNDNGTYTLVYEGCDTISTYGTTVYSTQATISSVVEELTKKPEVRVDQRSSLEVKDRQVVAQYYKDGFRTDSKNLIPAIKSIEVFNNNTVKMTFVNGDVQTSTVYEDDTFSLEDGILRCIVKEMIGKEGTAILGKLLSYATKVYNDAEEDKKKKAEEEKKKKAVSEKNYKKAKKHWEKKRAAERENRISEMAEAIVRAKKMENK